MSENVLRLSTIGQLLRRRRRLLLVLAALGAVLGAAAALLLPLTYESTSKVLLQGPREKEAVATEAQIAMSLVVLDRSAAELGWGGSGTELVDAVTATVAGGNVIEIKAKANDPTRARELADQVTQQYITFSTEIVTKAANATSDALRKGQADLQDQIKDINPRIGQLQGSSQLPNAGDPQAAADRAELQRLNTTRSDILDELANIDKQIGEAEAAASVSRDSIRVIEPAVQPAGALPPTPIQLIAGGAALGVLIGAFTLVAVRCADRRLRHRSDIATAVAAPVLGTVEPPAETLPAAAVVVGVRSSRAAHWWYRLTQFLGEEPEPSNPARDPALEQLRYRRALAQLHGLSAAPARLLVIVCEGDAAASTAAARLAVAVAATGRPVQVVTNDPRLSEAMRARRAGGDDLNLIVGPRPVPPPAETAVFDITRIPLTRPTIPNRPAGSRSLLVMSSGTATAWELVGIAEASRDAACPLVGVLLVSRTDEEEMPADEPGWQPPLGVAARAGHDRDAGHDRERSYADV